MLLSPSTITCLSETVVKMGLKFAMQLHLALVKLNPSIITLCECSKDGGVKAKIEPQHHYTL